MVPNSKTVMLPRQKENTDMHRLVTPTQHPEAKLFSFSALESIEICSTQDSFTQKKVTENINYFVEFVLGVAKKVATVVQT